MYKIPFQTINWTTVEKTEHKGEKGIAYSQTLEFDNIRIRLVEYSENYFADHWCQKGHIVHCLDGEFVTELEFNKLKTEYDLLANQLSDYNKTKTRHFWQSLYQSFQQS